MGYRESHEICFSGRNSPHLNEAGEAVELERRAGHGQISGGALPPKMVVLTYDDGPDDHTLEFAHYLADSGIPRHLLRQRAARFCKMAMAAAPA